MPETRSFHDEPFVIDNFPLEIDVGEKHATAALLLPPTPERPHWTRMKSHLNRLMVLRKDKNGKRFDFEVYELNRAQLIQVHLEGGASLDISLTLAADCDDSVLAIAPQGFRLKKDSDPARNRRLVHDGGRGRRITEVEIHSGSSAPPRRVDVDEGSVYLAFYLGDSGHR